MAGRLILATTGTSALDRRKLELLFLWDSYQSIRLEISSSAPQKLRAWVQGEGLPHRVSQFIEAYSDALYRLDIAEETKKPPKGINIFSGEMTSLYLMYRNAEKDQDPDPLYQHAERHPDLQDLNPKDDAIVFLLSDSAEGIFCGLLHRKWLAEGRFLRKQNVVPALHIIDGLQVENLPQFLQTGLKKFSDTLREYIIGRTRTSLLNATGGFKSLIPYATFFSLAYEMPMFFVFEELPHLIAIKPPSIEPPDKDRLLGFVQQALRQSSGGLELHLSDF